MEQRGSDRYQEPFSVEKRVWLEGSRPCAGTINGSLFRFGSPWEWLHYMIRKKMVRRGKAGARTRLNGAR